MGEKVAPEAEKTVEQTPTPVVEDLASLQAKLTNLETELKQTKQSLSTAHQTLTRKDTELKSQSDLRAEIQGIREDMELLAIGFATKGEEEPTDGVSRQNVLTELQKRRANADTKRKQDTDAIARQEYNQKADTVYAQAKTLYGEGEEEKLEDIEDLLKSGNIVRAEQRIARAIKSKTPKVETPKESEEERIERLVKERMEAKYPGVYASDIGGPSGSRSNFAEIERQYAEGEITNEQYSKARGKQGII